MFFLRDGVRLFYEWEGDRALPCITLLNGYSRDSRDFRALSKHLVSMGRSVLRMDNRGSGQTECEPGFTVNDMVEDVVSLWDHLSIEQSDVLGISYGGILSMLLAHRYPHRVRSLILVSTTPSSFFLGLDNNLSSQNPEQVQANLARYFSERFAADNPVLYRSLIKEMSKAFANPTSRERAAQQRRALNRFDFTPLLHSIVAPTLILHGAEDQVIVPEAADISHRAIKRSQLQIAPGVGHLFLAEAPKWLYERVGQFLQHQQK